MGPNRSTVPIYQVKLLYSPAKPSLAIARNLKKALIAVDPYFELSTIPSLSSHEFHRHKPLFHTKPNQTKQNNYINYYYYCFGGKNSETKMKITSLVVLKCNPEGSDPTILANAIDVSHFGFFQRSSVKEFIVFVSRTVAKRTPPDQRQSVQHEGPFTFFSIVFRLNPI